MRKKANDLLVYYGHKRLGLLAVYRPLVKAVATALSLG
jgi:hypothetical protein